MDRITGTLKFFGPTKDGSKATLTVKWDHGQDKAWGRLRRRRARAGGGFGKRGREAGRPGETAAAREPGKPRHNGNVSDGPWGAAGEARP